MEAFKLTGKCYMNLIHLKYFVELANTGHYTKTAEKLFITQPSLSHAISQLEAELGVPLFEKRGRNTELTCFGKQFLDCAEKTLETLNNGVEAIKLGSRGSGTIRLGFLRFMGIEFIPSLAEKFIQNNRDMDINFTFGTGTTTNLVDELLANHYDIIFSSKPWSDAKLTSAIILQQKLVLIVPAGHPLSSYDVIDLKDTLDYEYVYFSKNSGLRYVIDNMFEKIGEYPKIAYEIDEDQVIAGLVSRKFGIAVIPQMNLLNNINVKQIEIISPDIKRNIYMTVNNNIFVPPVVENFYKYILKETVFANSKNIMEY